MELEAIRKKIDKIDRELLVLLQERMGLALRSRKFKQAITDSDREADVLARAERMNLDLIKGSFSRQLLMTIIDQSKRLQREDRPLVAFQGEHGAYGEVAARRLVPEGAFIPCTEFDDVFNGVSNGTLDLGVVPVENSLEGAVTPVNDLLTTTELKVIGEVGIPVNHCLLAAEATDIRDVRQVYSHPQALAQCRRFLLEHQLEARAFYDTAGAAKMLARENPRAAAAIASPLCGDLYDLIKLHEGIADGPANSTRFLLLSREACTAGGEKTSLVFATPHEAGRLFSVLRLFADADINLTRIASMPNRLDPGNYQFFLDFEGAVGEPVVDAVLDKMQRLTITFKLLGSYPADSAAG